MSMYPIATWTATADNQEQSFLNIPQTFSHLQIRAFIKSPIVIKPVSTVAKYTIIPGG